MSDYKKIVVNTKNYSVEDMLQGTQPICDTKILEGNEWSFSQDELPATVYYETTSVEVPKVYTFASNEDHVEMSTGRTLREEYMGVLKAMGKEVPSADGSPIQVPNGIEARVINAEIKGQTVKSIANVNDSFRTAIGDGTLKPVLTVQDIGLVKPSSDYTLVTEVISNTLNGDFKLVNINTSNMMMDTNDSVPAGKTGIFIVKLRSKENLSGASQIIRHALTADSTSGSITYRSCVFEGDLTKVVKGFAPFGLVSTEAIISNNGEEYPIYEPTIQGKTRILKAPKGTQNWVEISPNEARDTTTYDYKLDSINGDLGGASSISDYIDRARKVKVVNTKEVELNTLTNWQTATTDGSITRFFNLSTSTEKKTGNSNIVCNSFTTGTSGATFAKEVSGYDTDGRIYIKLPNSIATTVEQLNTYLTQQKANGTPVTVRYQLDIPQEIPLTDEELKAYDAYKKVISLGGVGDVKDTLEILEDGSAIYMQRNAKHVVDGSRSFGMSSQNETLIGIGSLLPTGTFKADLNNIRIISDKIKCKKGTDCKPNAWSITSGDVSDESYIAVWDNGHVMAVLQKSVYGNNIDEVKSYLNTNPLTIIGQLATPIITHIPKELVQAILTHNKTNILEAGGAVKPSSFKVTVPTTDGIKKEYILTSINGWTGTAKANLLQTGDVGLVIDLTIPEQFNTLITNLPNELKPKSERTVLGYNGNTPVVVKIGTDGTVKLPISTTGTVKLDDTYKL